MEDFRNFIYNKCVDFSIRIMNLNRYLTEEKKEYVASNQILRSGTSIGANLAEAQYGISKKDFLSKTYISLKETAETMFWLDVLYRSDYLSKKEYDSIMCDCEELKKLFMSITKTTKESLKKNKTPNSTPNS